LGQEDPVRIAVAGGTGVVGRHVVAAAADSGHEPVVISRRTGVDVRHGDGLEGALTGCDVLIDTMNSPSFVGRKAESFFRETSQRLQQAGENAGVRHLVIVSIVGIDRVPGYGYYQAKLAHEAAARAGSVAVTVLRATQFHEFPAQVLSVTRKGPVAVMPRMRSQPVAARTVGQHLVRIAETQPGGTVELAGPEVHEMPELARRLLAAQHTHALVIPLALPRTRPMRDGALLAGADTRIDGPTFDEWLCTDDARQLSYPAS
jgi:uncharacterized protein YbjT (DUF2867 family)